MASRMGDGDNMVEGLNKLIDEPSPVGVAELSDLLRELLGADAASGRVVNQQRLNPRVPRVYRLQFDTNGAVRSLVVKRLEPTVARRNHLVITRWLPAAGLADRAPQLLGAAAERNGQCVWHVYEDLGDWALDANVPETGPTQAAIELIAQIHTRFAEHPLLPECRLFGGDLGIHFYHSNVRDAIRGLEALRPPAVALSAGHEALRDRLLERMQRLLEDEPARAEALADLGGPETLLHGDLWTTNTFVIPSARGYHARLIDWDHAAVGPASYDLSTFLLRFPRPCRTWILELYREAVAQSGWRLPAVKDLNLLFETAECARFANRILWPAIALVTERAEWAFDELAEVEQWFHDLAPVLPETSQQP